MQLLCTSVVDCMDYVLLVYTAIIEWCMAQETSIGPWPPFIQVSINVTREDGTDRLSRNVCKQLPHNAA
jgi:hypothetical protein